MKLFKSEKMCKTVLFWVFQIAMIAFYIFKAAVVYQSYKYEGLIIAIPLVLDIIAGVLITLYVNKNCQQNKCGKACNAVKYLLFGIALFILALISGITINGSVVCWVLTFVIAFIALDFSLYGLLFCDKKDTDENTTNEENKQD
jgi:hypothetical protein